MSKGKWSLRCKDCNVRFSDARDDREHWSYNDKSLYGPYWWCETCCKEMRQNADAEDQEAQHEEQTHSSWNEHQQFDGYENTGWNYYRSARWSNNARSSWRAWQTLMQQHCM